QGGAKSGRRVSSSTRADRPPCRDARTRPRPDIYISLGSRIHFRIDAVFGVLRFVLRNRNIIAARRIRLGRRRGGRYRSIAADAFDAGGWWCDLASVLCEQPD